MPPGFILKSQVIDTTFSYTFVLRRELCHTTIYSRETSSIRGTFATGKNL